MKLFDWIIVMSAFQDRERELKTRCADLERRCDAYRSVLAEHQPDLLNVVEFKLEPMK